MGALRGALLLSACIGPAGGVTAWALDLKIPDWGERPVDVAPAPKSGEPCDRCGVIRSIKEISLQRPVNVPQGFRSDPDNSGPGSSIPVGAVISIPLGSGAGNPFVGGVGTPEMRERLSATEYEITIRLDDGGYTMVQRKDGLAFRVGDRVRVQGTQIELLAP